MNGVAHLCMRGHACYTFLLVCSSNDIGCFLYVFDVFMDYCGIVWVRIHYVCLKYISVIKRGRNCLKRTVYVFTNNINVNIL